MSDRVTKPAGTSTEPVRGVARRTVAGRLLASYLVVLVAFSMTVGWSLLAQRDAARDAALLRGLYVPLLTSIGEALAGQNVLNAQLNHITSAKNPADVRQWIDTARRLRPLTIEKIRRDAQRAVPGSEALGPLRARVESDVQAIVEAMAGDETKFEQLFKLLEVSDRSAAESIRDELLAKETDSAKRLRSLRERVDDDLRALSLAANQREQHAIQLLVGLGLLTLLVGVGISLYARRVLAPLTVVTERARAVARGDLTPRAVVATDTEIGELASTFERMVAAIRRARGELVQAERLATLGKMAAHISHEIRNPLSSIGLNLELLEEEIGDKGQNPEAAQLLGAIQSEVDRLSRITEQYLAAARRPKLQLEPVALEDLVTDCHLFVRPELERAGLRSTVQVEAGLPLVDVDEARLRQALLNLVRNAQEATPRGGEIVLGVSAHPLGVLLTVEDQGPGVPEEHRASIFDPFYTTKERGTGLGLAVTRSIVEAHGGTIACKPRPHVGTRFEIALPATGRNPDAED